MAYTEQEIEEHLKRYGCFCGGHGTYTDYNCGASYEVTCPHCMGSGRKACGCRYPMLHCGHFRGGEVVDGS